MQPSAQQPYSAWADLAENGLNAWADASAEWASGLTRLATMQAEALGRVAQVGLDGWSAAFRLAGFETARERLLFAEDQAARVADAMRATLKDLKDLKEGAPPPPLPE